MRGLADRVGALDGTIVCESPLGQRHAAAGRDPMRVVIGEDQVLFREGLVALLIDAGFDVVAEAGDADELVRKVDAHRPDVVVTDVRMPPEHADDGLRAACVIRRRFPGTAVLVLSQYVATRPALELIAESAEGVGYLLKDRVRDLDQFVGRGAARRRGRLGAGPGDRLPAARAPARRAG